MSKSGPGHVRPTSLEPGPRARHVQPTSLELGLGIKYVQFGDLVTEELG
jgi:hypothetical protein